MNRSPPHTLLLAVLLAQISYGLLAMAICLPSMQEWGSIFGSDQANVQLTISGFVLAQGAMQLVYGPLSDRHGRKPVLLLGLSVSCAGSLLAAFAADLPMLIAARALQGAGAAAGLVVGRAMVQDLFDSSRRTQVMAYVGMTMGLSPPLAIVLGGQLHVRLGWQSNFALVGALALVLMFLAWRVLPASLPAPALQTRWWSAMLASYARLAREPRFLFYVLLLGMTTAAFYVFLGGAPIVLRSYGVGPQDVGWYMLAVPMSYILGNFLASRWAARLGDRRLMRLGQMSLFSGLCLMVGLGLAGLATPLAFALPLTLFGFGHGFLMPPALSGVVSLVPVLAGSASAVAGLVQLWLGALGGYSVGLLPSEGPVALGLLMLAFSIGALIAQWLLRLPIHSTSR